MTSPTGLLDPSPRGTMRVQGKQNLVLFPLGPVIKYSPPTNVARVGVPDSACGLSLLLVLVLACSERFFSGYSGFPSLQKTLNSNLIWTQWTKSHPVDVPLLIPIPFPIPVPIFTYQRHLADRLGMRVSGGSTHAR